MLIIKWPHWHQLALPPQLVATIYNLRLVGVEMTCSVSFGEPIKDGLSSVSHWTTEQDYRSRHSKRDQRRPGETCTGERYRSRFFMGGREITKQWEHIYWRHKVEDKRRAPSVCVCACVCLGGDCAVQGTHKCERRARKRLRCRESKLAAHLGCRSHQWKMQTSSPNISSGKTCFKLSSCFSLDDHVQITSACYIWMNKWHFETFGDILVWENQR